MANTVPQDVVPPEFARLEHKSPLTDPWEPIYWKKSGDGNNCLGLRLREVHCNSRRFAHGGLISALADNAMGLFVRASQAELGSETFGVTIHLGVSFLGKAHIGNWLEFRPRLLRLVSGLAFADCLVVAEQKLIARADATFRLLTTQG